VCKWGDTVDVQVTIPAHLSHTGEERTVVKAVDRCLAPIVEELNRHGFGTCGCCCGHGRTRPTILLLDRRLIADDVQTLYAMVDVLIESCGR
jgi:hypothetical protein